MIDINLGKLSTGNLELAGSLKLQSIGGESTSAKCWLNFAKHFIFTVVRHSSSSSGEQ